MNRPPERSRVDAESQSLLEELWATPVAPALGRSRPGLTSTAAMAAALNGVKPPAPAQAAQRPKRRRKESRDLHFAYGHLRRVSHLRLVGDGRRRSRCGATPRPRARRSSGGRPVEGGRPDQAVASTSRRSGCPRIAPRSSPCTAAPWPRRGGRRTSWHVPRGDDAHARQDGGARCRAPTGRWRARRSGWPRSGLKRSDVRAARHVMQLDSVGDSHTTASTIAMMHPNVATKDPTNAGVTKQVLGQTSAIGALGQAIAGLQGRGRNFGSLAEAKDADGTPTQIKVGDTTTTFNTFSFTSDAGFQRSLKSAVASGVQAVRDTGSLGAVIDQPLDTQPAASTKTWVQSQGAVPQTDSVRGPRAARRRRDRHQRQEPRQRVRHQGRGQRHVLQRPGPAQALQQLGPLGVGVRPVPRRRTTRTCPPTRTPRGPTRSTASRSACSPQVCTVLGIPVWDQNTITVNAGLPR